MRDSARFLGYSSLTGWHRAHLVIVLSKMVVVTPKKGACEEALPDLTVGFCQVARVGSMYYGGYVAKGGVFLQLSGKLGSWELWLGTVSDTNYLQRGGILEFQEEF